MDGGKQRGRGRGIVRSSQSIPKPPDKAAMEALSKEKASLTSSAASVPPDKVADAVEKDSKLTTTGKGKTPPLAQDLKETIRGGVQVSSGTTPQSFKIPVTIPNKLNPDARSFIPMSTTTYLDSDLNPHAHAAPSHSSAPPIYSKHSIPTSTSSTSSSGLDPKSKEFVPLGAGIPLSPPMSNGDVGVYGNGDVEEEAIRGYLESKDLVKNFKRAAPTMPNDAVSELVLKEAADVLLRVYNYPGSFDEIGKTFEHTLKHASLTEDILTNLAEMLTHWGSTLPELRYASSRLCHFISEIELEGKLSFSACLAQRLHAWYKECSSLKLSVEEEKYRFSNYTGFLAEIYAKITLDGKPLKFLGPRVFQCIEKLFGLRDDSYIREACNALKLTGSCLLTVEDYSSKLDSLKSIMSDLAIDRSLSKNCTALIMQVIELSSTKWRTIPAPTAIVPNPSPPTAGKRGDPAAGLNTNATPFVPSDPFLTETVYDMPVPQQPVSCASEWDEFVGEDQPVEGFNMYGSPDGGEDEYDGLDPDIELEMEAFIDEIEEHLMLQDFDPELRQGPKS